MEGEEGKKEQIRERKERRKAQKKEGMEEGSKEKEGVGRRGWGGGDGCLKACSISVVPRK